MMRVLFPVNQLFSKNSVWKPKMVRKLSMEQKFPDRTISSLSNYTLTRNIEYLSVNNVHFEKQPGGHILVGEKNKPLVVMLGWMLAERKHLIKYADIYFAKGYDVLTVTIKPWQLIWPLKGAQLIAGDILRFLSSNTISRPILLHGFSVGGYVWGEVLAKMDQNLDEYKDVIDRIIGQTWDSAADVTEIQKGLPMAMFPNNIILRSSLEKYIGYHMRTFYDNATQHYIRSSQMFHTTLVRAPALFLLCKTDPIGSVASNTKVREAWDSMGMKTYWKCWDHSKHVSHLLLHRKEYLEAIENFLQTITISESHVKQNEYQLKI